MPTIIPIIIPAQSFGDSLASIVMRCKLAKDSGVSMTLQEVKYCEAAKEQHRPTELLVDMMLGSLVALVVGTLWFFAREAWESWRRR